MSPHREESIGMMEGYAEDHGKNKGIIGYINRAIRISGIITSSPHTLYVHVKTKIQERLYWTDTMNTELASEHEYCIKGDTY